MLNTFNGRILPVVEGEQATALSSKCDPSPKGAVASKVAKTYRETASELMQFQRMTNEVMGVTHGRFLEDLDSDARERLMDKLLFEAENQISARPMIPYVAWFLLVLILCLILAAIWIWILEDETSDHPEEYADVYGHKFDEAIWLSMQVFISAGYEELPSIRLRIVYMSMLFGGVFAFAVLVGFITEAVAEFMANMSSGLTKVSQSEHTLILGWTEATVRVVCQLAQLRAVHFQNNRSWARTIFWWRRIPASTIVAKSRIVVMCNQHEKAEMERQLSAALAERSITQTRIGADLICRVGDPTDVHDLVRVAAHRASAILVMVTEADVKEEERTKGLVYSGTTIRCLLALRHVCVTGSNVHNDDLRIVVQLHRKADAVKTACFPNAHGENIVYPVDLSVFLNSLLFSCAVQPGLPHLLIELLDFQGFSIRRRYASELGLAGFTFRQAMCALDNAVLMGVINPGVECLGPEYGLCPPDDLKIKESDLLIFVSETSWPRVNFDGEARSQDYRQIAKTIKPHDEQTKGQDSKRKVFVCGWRETWSKDGDRLAKRFAGLANQLTAGSAVVFFNLAPPSQFEQIMNQNGFKPLGAAVWDWGSDDSGIRVSHVQGDAANLAELEHVVLNPCPCDSDRCNFDTVIIMGTTCGAELDVHSRDTRILTVLLLLRGIRERHPELPDMHVISENSEDATAVLAIPPTLREDCTKHADFVNSQAIGARVLAQCLAYPKISGTVLDLLDDQGTVNPMLVAAETFVPLNQELAFGVVQELIKTHAPRAFHDVFSESTAMGIGLMTKDGDVTYLWPESRREYEEGDRLICLVREIPPVLLE